jgi:hypothetical protein
MPLSPIDRLILSQAASNHGRRERTVKIDFRKLVAKGVDPAMIERVKQAEARLKKNSKEKR